MAYIKDGNLYLESSEVIVKDGENLIASNSEALTGTETEKTISPSNLKYVIENIYTIIPGATNTYDLGTSDKRFRTIYTNDLELKNQFGDYTIVEGETDLFLYNNKTKKVFRFLLQEVSAKDAVPKVGK